MANWVTLSLAEPLGCCFPARFHGYILKMEGHHEANHSTAEAIDDHLEIHYDYTKKKMTVVSHALDTAKGTRDNTTVIYDYANSRMYILPQDGSCHIEKLDPNTMYDPCMAQRFTVGDSFTMGSSFQHFQINTFDGNLGNLKLSIVVSADDCYPVADKLYGMSGSTQFVAGYLFMDIDVSAVDDTAFTSPANCAANPGTIGVGKRDLEILGLKRRPLSYVL